MNTLTLKTNNNNSTQGRTKKKIITTSLMDRYNEYVAKQEAMKVYHYLVVIIVIPCVYMTTSIIAMAAMVDWFVYYIAFTMVLFFANVIVHIGEGKSKVFIPLFHITTLLFIAVPAITYLITKM